MLVLLSPSKTLDFDAARTVSKCTIPEHLDAATELMGLLRRYSKRQLQDLMGTSDKLTAQVAEYIDQWETPFTANNARPAVLAFKGDVYEGLGAASFKTRDFEFCQRHLRILSGLYGILRPLDLIQPYRLEMGCPLARRSGAKAKRFAGLYEFWGTRITDTLAAALAAQKDDVFVNLASAEYFKPVEVNRLSARIITPVFKEARNGTYKVLSFFAKQARGQMARFILANRLKNPDRIRDFNQDGYRYSAAMSSDRQPVFTRG